MNNHKIHSILSIILLFNILVLLNCGSVQLNPVFYHHVFSEPIPAGATPPVAQTRQLTYIPDYPVMMIGDSRTVGMQQALKNSQYDLTHIRFTAKVGQGYSWFTGQTGLTELSPSILVLNLGVNDLGNISHYQSIYTDYADTCWKDSPIYIVSVNPVCSPCSSVTNQQIRTFNQSMQDWINAYNTDAGASRIRYIDTYSYLINTGFSSPDGLHYSASTYTHIYEYILEQIEEPIGDGTGSYVYTVSS